MSVDSPRPATPPWRHIVLLTVAGVLLRLLVRRIYGIEAAFGEDAEYWGYSAVEMRHGTILGSHPPLYPALMLLFAKVGGTSLAEAGSTLSLWAGALMAPAIALAMTPVIGASAAALCGWFVLLFPGLLSVSLRVEPTGLFVVFVAAMLYTSARATQARSVGWGVVTGLLLALTAALKETGLTYGVLLVPLLGVAVAERRWKLVVMPAIAAAVPIALLMHAQANWKGVFLPKAQIPMEDLKHLIEEGRLPQPIFAKEDPAIKLDGPTKQALSNPATTPQQRAGIYAGIQARRLFRFLGAWLLLFPVAVWVTWRLWRKGELTTWQAALLVALTALLAPAAIIIVQPRHAEPGAFGILAAVSLALVRLPTPWRHRAIAAAILLFGAQGIYLFRAREAPSVRMLATCGVERQKVAWQLEGWVRPNERLCSWSYWVGFHTERLVQACDGYGDSPLPPGTPAWVIGSTEADHVGTVTDDLHAFEQSELHGLGTVDYQKVWDSECTGSLKLGKVRWGG